MRSLVIYKKLFTKEFVKRIDRYKHLKRQIKTKIDLLCKDPYHNCKSELLVANLKGLRSARFTKNIRIIFVICEEFFHPKCKDLGKKSIVFITIDIHNKAYK